MNLNDLSTEVLQYIGMGILAVLAIFWKYFKAAVNYLVSKKDSTVTGVSLNTSVHSVAEDMAAVTYLVDRAIEFNDKELLTEVKAINAKIFNNYCDVLVSRSSDTQV